MDQSSFICHSVSDTTDQMRLTGTEWMNVVLQDFLNFTFFTKATWYVCSWFMRTSRGNTCSVLRWRLRSSSAPTASHLLAWNQSIGLAATSLVFKAFFQLQHFCSLCWPNTATMYQAEAMPATFKDTSCDLLTQLCYGIFCSCTRVQK